MHSLAPGLRIFPRPSQQRSTACGSPIGVPVDLVEFRLAVFQASFDDHLGQLSQSEGEVGEARAGLDDVFHVDTEQFLILEAIQCVLPSSVILGSFHDAVERLAERRARRDERRFTIVVKQRQEVIMLAAEEVFPEKSLAPRSRAKSGNVFLSLRNARASSRALPFVS